MRRPDETPAAWFELAEADLQTADLALGRTGLEKIAGYHAQQCAEKYLKGFLVSRDIQFKFVHELTYLLDLCLKADEEFESLMPDAAELEDFATEARYPGAEEPQPVTAADAKLAVGRARRIREIVQKKMNP